jgi:formate hydrogenlyase subunit 4
MAEDIILQLMQVLAVLLLSPLLQGILVQMEVRVKRGKGPGVFQPYRDLWKLFHKQLVLPNTSSWIFYSAPVVAFVVMTIVPMLIPVITNFPLPLSDMGDILGGGFLLALGGFMILLAGLDTGSAYGGMGSSRSTLLVILSEPILILVLVGIAVLSKAMLPFVINHLVVNHLYFYWNPAHLFLVAAFFIILLIETDAMPIHSGTHIEIYMIEESRILEYSGPLLGLLKWAGMMKRFIIYTLFCNMLFFPWWLSSSHNIGFAFVAIVIMMIKYTVVAAAVVLVNTAQARLRFFRYQEPLALGFILAVLAIVILQIGELSWFS